MAGGYGTYFTASPSPLNVSNLQFFKSIVSAHDNPSRHVVRHFSINTINLPIIIRNRWFLFINHHVSFFFCYSSFLHCSLTFVIFFFFTCTCHSPLVTCLINRLMLLLLLRKKLSSSFAGSFCVFKCRIEFSMFGVFARIEPATSEQTVPHSDQLN